MKYLIFLLPILAGCANQMSPQGGPKDSLPPVVRLLTPRMGVRNAMPKRIFVETDEYIQLKDLSKELYTSPLMKTRPTVTIKGRGFRIDIKDTLKENQTYAINFGNAVRDNNEGNPLTGFRYVFSTGSALDSLLVTGYVADASRGDSVGRAYIFFYDGIDSVGVIDSTMFNLRPSAVGRSEANGIFIAQNLRDTRYRVYALLDNNNNQKYDPGTDKVGFLDTLVSPAAVPSTAVWLDSYRKYPTADPQLYMRMFSEPGKTRQNLSASERPRAHQVTLRFAAPWPRIDTLNFEGIDNGEIIREYLTPDRDTLSLWFDRVAMPDTLRGRIAYHKPDSLGNMVPMGQNLRLVWRKVETKEEEREREKQERERRRAESRGETYEEPPVKNPFGFRVDAGARVNPQKNIPIEFDMPLVVLDSARVVLERVPALGDAVAMPYRLVQDSVNVRRWEIRAEWDEEENYRLIVPGGAFVNVAGERNDSLGAKFSIERRSDFVSLLLDVRGKGADESYIVEVVDGKGKQLRELRGVKSGLWEVHYLAEGDLRIKITQDMNGNGKWDSGVLVERRQPERVEYYVDGLGSQVIAAAKGREIEVTLDMGQIFGPVSIERIQRELQRAEDVRVAKFMEEKAKKDEERRRTGTGQEQGGGLGIGSAMGSAKSQIQGAVR